MAKQLLSGRKGWQAIGKRGQLEYWQAVVRSGAGNCGVGHAAVNLQLRNAAENLLASHRGELRPKAAEVQNHRRSRTPLNGNPAASGLGPRKLGIARI